MLHRGAAFAEDCLLIDLDAEAVHIAKDDFTPESEIWRALVLGTRDYARKSGLRRAVLGLSGGVDSALVAAIACEALGSDKVTGVLMPSPWSSDHSLADAHELAHRLHMATHVISIEAGMQAFTDLLTPALGQLNVGEQNLTAENIQARIRGILLMAFSNKCGALLLNTGNKSEIAVGYSTLYGDMCGGLAVIADLLKTQVYRICRWLNIERGTIIPENTLSKAPSAELRPGQTDQDSLPPYDQLDAILHLMLGQRLSFQAIQDAGHDALTIRRVAALVGGAEFKRHQAPPGLKVSESAVNLGWRMPIACRHPYDL